MRKIVSGFLVAAVVASACSTSFAPRPWAKRPGSRSRLFAFERSGRVGFIDSAGKIVIPPTIKARLDEVGDFSDGLASVFGSGYIDQSGRWVIERKFLAAGDYSEGLAWVRVYGEKGLEHVLLDRNGVALATVLVQSLQAFSEGLAAFEAPAIPRVWWKNVPQAVANRHFPGPKGFLNHQGHVVIEPVFAEVGPFRNGLAVAVLDGYCHIAKPEGGRAGSPTSGNVDFCGGSPPPDAVAPCRTGFIDRSGRWAIEARFESAQDFHERLAAVRTEGRWGFIWDDGAFAIPPRFEQVKPFSEGLAAVRVGKKWGFVDIKGQFVIEPTFQAVEPFSESLAIARTDRGTFFIDTRGNTVIPGPFQEAAPFVHGLAAVLLPNNRVAYIDRTGKKVFQYSLRR